MEKNFLENNFYDPQKINIMIERSLLSAALAVICVASFFNDLAPEVSATFCGVVALIAFLWRFVNDIILMCKFDKERYALIEKYEKGQKGV